MPISSNKSKLKVETNIAGTIYEDETTRDVYYPRNQQREQRRVAGSHPMDIPVYGRDNKADAEEFEMSPEMEKALNNDLADKGVTPKPKRTRKKKTTTTDKTNDQS